MDVQERFILSNTLSLKNMSQSKEVLIGGLNTIMALLESDKAKKVTTIWLQENRKDGRFAKIEKQARRLSITLHRTPRKALDNQLPDIKHQGVIAAFEGNPPLMEQDLVHIIESLESPAMILVLDGVQDPHNLGACLRSAAGAGVDLVIAPKDRAAGITPVVRKVASGGAETVPFLQVANLSRTLENLQRAGVHIVGLAGEATESLYQTDLTRSVALVLGSEGEGMRRLTKSHCNQLVKIPLNKDMESLNVSVAAGICLFETVRQRF